MCIRDSRSPFDLYLSSNDFTCGEAESSPLIAVQVIFPFSNGSLIAKDIFVELTDELAIGKLRENTGGVISNVTLFKESDIPIFVARSRPSIKIV